MIKDIFVNFGSKALNDLGENNILGDSNEADSILQSLLFRIFSPKGSFIFNTSLGSELFNLKKNSPTLEADFSEIVSDAWADEISNGTISDFTVDSFSFDTETRRAFFSITARIKDVGIVTISNANISN